MTVDPAPIPDLIYDVGMHRGEDTDYYLRKGFRVIGFEADPRLAARCGDRFASEIAADRLIIVEGAIAEAAEDAAETITFYRNVDLSVWGTIDASWAERNTRAGTRHEAVEVRRVDFSATLAAYGIPHYLKIDIEGADLVCLRSLLEFEARPNYVSLESDRRSLDEVEAEIDLLSTLGYTTFQAVQQVGLSRQREPRRSTEGRYVGHRFVEGSSGLFGGDLPGPWLDGHQIMDRYRAIFRENALWGEEGLVRRWGLAGTALRRFSSWLLRRPLPGWYDTHARHWSAG